MRKLFYGWMMLMALCQYGCSKDQQAKQGEVTLRVLLTDNPLGADEVNVEILQVRVKLEDHGDEEKGWYDLETRAGIYNLLELQNGVTEVLAEGPLPSRHVQEIRLVLGTQNSIVFDGISFGLTTPSAQSSGLKIKVGRQLRGPLDEIIIDFDAALSVHQTGNGRYMLKPVLKLK